MFARPKTILLIDDSNDSIALYQNIFRQSCIRVLTITSADIAQLDDIIDQVQPFLILVDYRTVQSRDAQTIHHLSVAGATIPNVIITTSCDSGMCEAFDYVVLKPFTADTLNSIIADVLRRDD